ncbi:MAG: DNA-directed RNA polymerase subunit omega [Clostridia bacterium]|nr:DNA-directed RNA polymerase subunit omega [Clostridia bacterium]
MISVDLQNLMKNENMSRYELAVATAKRTREIVDEANEEGKTIAVKPVSIAVEEYEKGMWEIKRKY